MLCYVEEALQQAPDEFTMIMAWRALAAEVDRLSELGGQVAEGDWEVGKLERNANA